MEETKVLAYSFMAHLNNNRKGQGFNDIFIPLVKRTLSKLNTEGRNMGQIDDIREEFTKLYKLDIPYPMLKELLKTISIEVKKTNKGQMKLYHDFSYILDKYTFEDYEEIIKYKRNKIKKLEKTFDEYVQNCAQISQYEERLDLFSFIDRNRTKLSKFLSDSSDIADIPGNADIEMQFIKYIKEENIELYDVLKEIYIGSIISAYIEVGKIESRNESMQFVIDTNFVISLLGLHSNENLDTCNKIIEICKKVGHKIVVTDITIEETEHILNKLIDGYECDIIQRCYYNSTQYICQQNNITKTDLQYRLRNLKKIFAENGISVIYLKTQYKNETVVRNGEIYKKLSSKVYTDKNSILHDAIIIDYVSKKRGNTSNSFVDMKIWFLTESKKFNDIKTKHKYPEAINSNELVNILWLMKPVVSTDDIFNLGLGNLFAEVIESNQPSKKVIREIDANIKKYREHINDDDIVALGSMVSDSPLRNIKNINREYEEVNELLENRRYEDFSEKIKDMQKYQEELKNSEINKLNEEFQEEKKNDLNKFIDVLTGNKISDYYEQNLKYDNKRKELIDKNNETKKVVKKITQFLLWAIVIIVSIILIIYKNLSSDILKINIIDIIFFITPILFGGIVNYKISDISERISKWINKSRMQEINELNRKINLNENDINMLNEMKIDFRKTPKDEIENFVNNERYKKIIKKIGLLTMFQSENI